MLKNNCRKRIEELLKKNGKMYPSDIADKTRCPYSVVINNLNDLKKRGLVSIARWNKRQKKDL